MMAAPAHKWGGFIGVVALCLGACSDLPEQQRSTNANARVLIPDPEGEARDIIGPETRTEIPTAFQGAWNVDKTDCGTGNTDSRLRIGPKALRYSDSVGDVTSVAVKDARNIAATASFSGEGKTWVTTRRYTLSADGQTLDADGAKLLRCPPAATTESE